MLPLVLTFSVIKASTRCAKVRIHHGAILQRPANSNGINADSVAPRHGFDPRFTAPKAAVLPLDDRGVWHRTPMAGAGGGHRLLFKVTRARGLNRGAYSAHASVPHGYQSE